MSNIKKYSMFNTVKIWAAMLFQQYDGRKKFFSRESKDTPKIL